MAGRSTQALGLGAAAGGSAGPWPSGWRDRMRPADVGSGGPCRRIWTAADHSRQIWVAAARGRGSGGRRRADAGRARLVVLERLARPFFIF